MKMEKLIPMYVVSFNASAIRAYKTLDEALLVVKGFLEVDTENMDEDQKYNLRLENYDEPLLSYGISLRFLTQDQINSINNVPNDN